ncbi:hypothetical protein [Sphingomonas humi]
MQGQPFLALVSAPTGAMGSRAAAAAFIMTMIITSHPWGASG